jgi:hypothetical protein
MNDEFLLEQSFADAAKAIEGAVDLPAQTRTQWLCSLRQIAQGIGQADGADPGALDGGALLDRPAPPCGRWLESEDPREPQGQRAGGSALVR